MYRRVASVVTLLGAGAIVAAAGVRGSEANGARLELTPRTGTFDVPVTIEASGLPPDAEATVRFGGRSSDGSVWRGRQLVRVSRDGTLDLPHEYPFDLMRRATARTSKLPVTVPTALPHTVQVVVTARRVRASSTVRRFSAATLVSSHFESVKKLGFYGVWYLPRQLTGRHTAILLLGGSLGGLADPYIGETLAARGYPVLDLAYFDEPGLPQHLERIPLEYFQQALKWMAVQPQVDPRRVVSLGISRGGELSLLLGSTFPQLIHGVVGYVPSIFAGGGLPDGTVPAWTYHGAPISGEIIPVEKISGPVFVAGGGYDAVWASSLYVQMIAQRLHHHGRRDVVALSYPTAGHGIGLVIPIPPLLNSTAILGGSTRANDVAREDAWPKLLRFLGSISG
jgi:dienelactone hydrolase